IVQMVADANAATPNDLLLQGDGEVCLSIDLDAQRQPHFTLSKFEAPQKGMSALLDGTIWMDVFNDCLKPLVDFFKKETTPQPGEENQLVGPTARRIIAAENLLIQLVNP